MHRDRAAEAKHMLEATDTGIEEIAEQVGYEDSSSFRRLFKRMAGAPPTQYRERYRLPSPANRAAGSGG